MDGNETKSDVWLTVHRNSVWIRKTNWMSLFVFFISFIIVAQHVSGNHVPIIVRTHPWTHYLPTGLDNLLAATAHTNTRL